MIRLILVFALGIISTMVADACCQILRAHLSKNRRRAVLVLLALVLTAMALLFVLGAQFQSEEGLTGAMEERSINSQSAVTHQEKAASHKSKLVADSSEDEIEQHPNPDNNQAKPETGPQSIFNGQPKPKPSPSFPIAKGKKGPMAHAQHRTGLRKGRSPSPSVGRRKASSAVEKTTKPQQKASPLGPSLPEPKAPDPAAGLAGKAAQYEQQGQPDQAAIFYHRLVRLYPRSALAPIAQKARDQLFKSSKSRDKKVLAQLLRFNRKQAEKLRQLHKSPE